MMTAYISKRPERLQNTAARSVYEPWTRPEGRWITYKGTAGFRIGVGIAPETGQ